MVTLELTKACSENLLAALLNFTDADVRFTRDDMSDTNNHKKNLIQVCGISLALVFMFLAFISANEIRDINQNHRNLIDSYKACTEGSSRCEADRNIELYSSKSHHVLDTNINLVFSFLLFAFLILGALERVCRSKSNHTLKNDAQESAS